MDDSKAIASPRKTTPAWVQLTEAELSRVPAGKSASWITLAIAATLNFGEGPSGFCNFQDLPEPCPFLLFPGPCLLLLLPGSYGPPTFPQEGTFQLEGEQSCSG